MAKNADADGLATIWHLGDAAHCARLLPYFLEADDQDFGDLVAGEVIEERIAGELQHALVRSLQTSARPPLSPDTVDRLIGQLVEEEGTGLAGYEPIRTQVATWAVEQKTQRALAYALRVLAGEVPGSDDALVRAAARARVSQESESFETARDAA